MNSIADPKTRSFAASRARSIHTGVTLSKKKALEAHAKFIKEHEVHTKQRAAFHQESKQIQKHVATAFAKENPALRSAVDALRKSVRRHLLAVKLPHPSFPMVHPRISTGSIISFLTPPFWNIWTSFSAPHSSGNANSNVGTFGSQPLVSGPPTLVTAGSLGFISPSPILPRPTSVPSFGTTTAGWIPPPFIPLIPMAISMLRSTISIPAAIFLSGLRWSRPSRFGKTAPAGTTNTATAATTFGPV